MAFKSNIPNVYSLLADVPEKDQPEDKTLFWKAVAGELSMLIEYASKCADPQIVFSPMRKASSQYIWEFFVNDLVKPKTDAINWHGQNISQWNYAGCVLLQGNKVSTHH